MKKIWIVIILVLVGAYFLLTNIDPSNLINSSSYDSIKDISINPQDYYETEVTIRGILAYYAGRYTLMDNEGYWVQIGTDLFGKPCQDQNRIYTKGETYTAKGIFTEGTGEGYGKENSQIVCSQAIN